MSWETVKLADLCTVITKGTTPSNIGADFTNRGINYIRSEMITNAKYIVSDGMLYISNETHEKLKRSQLQKGDILFSMAGVYLGKTAVLREEDVPANTNQAVALIRINSLKCNLEYVYYFLNLPETVTKVNTVSGQAAQPNINLKQIGNIEICLPSLENQNKIVDILSAYDDLIENNQKQIKLFEESAQRLYKEWFVDLRFPGHETTSIIDGIPQGWKRERLVDIADVQYGYSFDGAMFNSDGKGMPIIRIRNIPDGITKDFTTEEADERYIVENGEIVVGMDGGFHINSWNGSKAYLVQRSCCIRPQDSNMKGYLLQAIYEPIKFFESTIQGATVAHLGKKHIDTITVLTAPEEMYKPFQQYFNKRQLLLNQNQRLAEARDRLLPKLMSGELEV